MGQKVHPIGFRVGITRGWDSLWYAGTKREYTQMLHEDLAIREFIKKNAKEAGVSRIEIKRIESNVKVYIYCSKPGIIFGRKSKGIEVLKANLAKIIKSSNSQPHIIQIPKPDLHAQLVAEDIARNLEKRVNFRRAMKKAVQQSMRAGAGGIKVMCSGRLQGADMARCEWVREGRVPLHTLRADIDYGQHEAKTTYGITGVKVWIYRGEFSQDNEETN